MGQSVRASAGSAVRSEDADLSGAVRDAQLGSTNAFRVLFRDTQPRLLRYLYSLVGDDAEDVASETWLQVVRDLGNFSGDHDGFRAWVTTIGRHRALDHLRRQGRRPPAASMSADDMAELPSSDDTAIGAIEQISTEAAVRLIATLPRDQAEAVLLRAVVGLDADTAGRVLGKRAGAVRTAAYRGLRTLAKRLDPGSLTPVCPLPHGPLRRSRLGISVGLSARCCFAPSGWSGCPATAGRLTSCSGIYPTCPARRCVPPPGLSWAVRTSIWSERPMIMKGGAVGAGVCGDLCTRHSRPGRRAA